MTIYDETSRRQRFGYHQTVQTQARTSYLSLTKKDARVGHERSQKKKHEERDLRFLRNPDETYKITTSLQTKRSNLNLRSHFICDDFYDNFQTL